MTRHLSASAVLAAAVVVPLTLSGCVATSRELVDLRDDIHELQLTLNDMRRNQADLSLKIDGVTAGMGPLTAELQETQNRMSLLGQRLDDVESNISQRMNKLAENMSGSSLSVPPPPSEIYRLAYSDFSRGKYDLATVGFRSYLEKYPGGELAAQAQYYLGECLYAQNEWEKALDEFETVEKKYPKSDSVAPARLKTALSLELLGRRRESQEIFASVVKDFPGTPESFTAQEKLKSGPSNAQ